MGPLRQAVVRTITRPTPVVRAAHRVVGFALERTGLTARARLASGGVLHVDLSNSVGRTIWLRGEFLAECAVARVVESILRPGDVFIDVGANVGFYTVLASRLVGGNGAVHAFEPLPRVAALLRKTIRTNRLSNVVLTEAAVSSASGTEHIVDTRDSAYAFMVPRTAGNQKAQRVQTVTLDDYVSRMNVSVRLVKLDIQGSEAAALDGGRRILTGESAPDVICEVSQWHLGKYGRTPEEVFAMLASWGYEALDPNSLRPMTVADLNPRNENVYFRRR